MSRRQLFTACGIAMMRQASSQGGLDKLTIPQDNRYLTICALRRRSATARELQLDLRIDSRTDLFVVRGNFNAAGYIEQILLQHMWVAAYGVGPEFVLVLAALELSCEKWTFKRWNGQH